MIKRYLPLILGLIILIVIAVLAPWGQIEQLFGQVSLGAILLLTLLAGAYYVGKAVRYWWMLGRLGEHRSLPVVMLCYMAAQPFTILPAGELYRTVVLKRYTGIPIARSASTVTMQGLIEAIILLLFALFGAFIIGKNRSVVIIVTIALAAFLLALKRGWLHSKRGSYNRLPVVSISLRRYNKFISDQQQFLKRGTLMPLLAISFVPVIAGVCIFWVAVNSLGSDLSLAQASIGYSLPVVLSGLSLLPGGIGASEGSTIGILKLFGAGTAIAIAITLLVRVFTLGAGMVFGLIGIVLARIFLEEHKEKA